MAIAPSTLDDTDLGRPCGPNPAPGFPPPQERSLLGCLRVVLGEEWAHHRFAVRDLTALEAAADRRTGA